MARKTAIEDEDGLRKGFYSSSPEQQKERIKSWDKAQKAIAKLSKDK
jgi:hypothetical protein